VLPNRISEPTPAPLLGLRGTHPETNQAALLEIRGKHTVIATNAQ
jgi:hypothetical protein